MASVAAPSDLHRLALEAERRKLTILVEHGTEAHFCTSATKPDTLYRVTAYSCSCWGFVRAGRCTHHARLLDYMGWLPDTDPDPASPMATIPPVGLAADCPLCFGSGRHPDPGYSVHVDHRSCPVCDGTGMVEARVTVAADPSGRVTELDAPDAHLDRDDDLGEVAA